MAATCRDHSLCCGFPQCGVLLFFRMSLQISYPIGACHLPVPWPVPHQPRAAGPAGLCPPRRFCSSCLSRGSGLASKCWQTAITRRDVGSAQRKSGFLGQPSVVLAALRARRPQTPSVATSSGTCQLAQAGGGPADMRLVPHHPYQGHQPLFSHARFQESPDGVSHLCHPFLPAPPPTPALDVQEHSQGYIWP